MTHLDQWEETIVETMTLTALAQALTPAIVDNTYIGFQKHVKNLPIIMTAALPCTGLINNDARFAKKMSIAGS